MRLILLRHYTPWIGRVDWAETAHSVEEDCSLDNGMGVSYAPYSNSNTSSQNQKSLNLEILNPGCDVNLLVLQ